MSGCFKIIEGLDENCSPVSVNKVSFPVSLRKAGPIELSTISFSFSSKYFSVDWTSSVHAFSCHQV